MCLSRLNALFVLPNSAAPAARCSPIVIVVAPRVVTTQIELFRCVLCADFPRDPWKLPTAILADRIDSQLAAYRLTGTLHAFAEPCRAIRLRQLLLPSRTWLLPRPLEG